MELNVTRNEHEYLKVLRELVALANDPSNIDVDRTGTGTVSVFGRMLRFDLRDRTIPLLTTKQMPFRTILREVLWYLQGTGDIQYLVDNNVKIWNEWADDNQLGPVYGVQWRDWNNDNIDQIANLINDLKTNPTSRRMLVTAWNPSVLPDPSIDPKENVKEGKQALPPCHYNFQLYSKKIAGSDKRELSLLLNQRSCDFFLGGAFNIASYSILLRMICHVTGDVPGELVWSIGDCHLYTNHIDQAREQLSRTGFDSQPELVIIDKNQSIDDFIEEDFVLGNYHHESAIKAPVAI